MAKNKRLADDGLLVEEGFEQQPREEDVPLEEQIGPHDSMAEEKFVRTANVSEDEVGMRVEPAIVGPPAYGSPDPDTSAGRLLSLKDHPLTGVGKISDDYGDDVRGAEIAFGEEGQHHGAPTHTDLERAQLGGADTYDEMTVPELKELAKQRGMEGTSSMNKADLVAAHEDFDENGLPDQTENS